MKWMFSEPMLNYRLSSFLVADSHFLTDVQTGTMIHLLLVSGKPETVVLISILGCLEMKRKFR